MKFVLLRIALLALAASTALAAAPTPKTEMTVQLPPFIIEQPAGPKWRYLEIPRFEILSRCNDATTARLALSVHRSNQLLGLILPARFQMAMDLPQTLIFYDEKLWSPAERDAIAAMLFGRAAPPPRANAPRVGPDYVVDLALPGLKKPAGDVGASFYGNLMLADVDSMTTFALASDVTIDPNETYFTPDYVYSLLRGRAPALPEWFLTGFIALYRDMEFHGDAVVLKPTRWADEPVPGDKGRQRQPVTFLPWADFFAATSRSRAEHPSLWMTQALVFLQWGLDPEAGHVDAFWQFVDRAAAEPDAGKAFAESFGFGFDEASRQIGAYGIAAGKVRWLLSEEQARLPNRSFEDATPRQIARLKGEWERLETRYVRANFPELEAQYLALARRTLHKAYDQEDRDPRLLATLGLLEFEAGNRDAARDFLGEAVLGQGSVVRPRACFELARLRYDREFGRSPRNDGRFTREQTAEIVGPLLLAARQAPPLPQVYELFGHVYRNSVDAASPEVLAVLAEGRKFFPQADGAPEWAFKPHWPNR